MTRARDLSTALYRHVNMAIPVGLDADLHQWLVDLTKAPEVVDEELRRIRHQFEGGEDALTEEYHPKPPKLSDPQWRANKRLLAHVNLIQPVVRTWVNATYGPEVQREAKTPYDELNAWFKSEAFEQIVYDWTVNKVVYGTSVAVPYYNRETKRRGVWLPDPLYTWIWCNPFDIYDVWGIAEVRPDRIRFIAKTAEGYITPDGNTVELRDYGTLPVVIGYGIDRRSRGEIQGLTLVRDAYTATLAATAVLYNTRLLQRQSAASRLVRIGELDRLMAADSKGAGSSGGGSIDVPAGGDAKYISPQAPIDGSLEMLPMQLRLLSTSGGVPADILDPTLTESASSAEGARIRMIPLLLNAKPLGRAWKNDEIELGYAMVAITDYFESAETPINMADVRKRSSFSVKMKRFLLPMSANEETQDVIAQCTFGLMTPEDAVREKHGDLLTPEEVTVRADTIRKNMAAAKTPQALEQQIAGGGRPAAAQN